MLLAFAFVLLPAAAGACPEVITSGATDVKAIRPALTADACDAPLVSFARESPTSHKRRSDSLWNGVLIGAGVGAVLGAVIGHAISDCSECSGFYVPLTFGVVGAGVGAGVGAAIDAVRHSQSTATAPGTRTRRVNLAPRLARNVKGISLSIHF